MRAVVKKWGNSASIRIPSNVLKAAKIEIDDPVDIREEQGRIVVEPLRPPSYDLANLLEKITPDNLHDETDFGRPVGKERL
jgi:antitoxin MazE